MINLNKIKNVLFMFCHPDDETLGAEAQLINLKEVAKTYF